VIRTLAWVTASEARGLDEDEPAALAALREAGVTVEVLDWDDPDVDWSGFDRAVLRSCWDYTDRPAEFVARLDAIAAVTELVNPPATVRWNLDKRYLGELEAAGLPITPTTFVPPGMDLVVPSGSFVVKPAIGAGCRDAASYDPDEVGQAVAHVARLHAAGTVALVQPLLRSVAVEGDWALVFLGGRFSHAASKRVGLPRAGTIDGLFAPEVLAAHEPSAEQVGLAGAVMDAVSARFGSPAYGRVDLVRDDDGALCVLEVELIEPSLFLGFADGGAVDRLVRALTS